MSIILVILGLIHRYKRFICDALSCKEYLYLIRLRSRGFNLGHELGIPMRALHLARWARP